MDPDSIGTAPDDAGLITSPSGPPSGGFDDDDDDDEA